VILDPSSKWHWRAGEKRKLGICDAGKFTSQVLRTSLLIEVIVPRWVTWRKPGLRFANGGNFGDEENAIDKHVVSFGVSAQEKDCVLTMDERASNAKAEITRPGSSVTMTPKKRANPDERIVAVAVSDVASNFGGVVRCKNGCH
jgi:hypothetical protein